MALPKYVHGKAFWPGVESFLGATYTISHGISPGICVYRCAPQEFPPAMFGDLVITDNYETVTLPDCRLQSMRVERNERGFYWVLAIADRRWRWGQFGFINGSYNQYAPVGQQRLVPWTIRSPRELAELCLKAMGETSYDLGGLPQGIDFPGPWYPNPIINVSGVNPPVNWEGVPPAQALQQVAERCGCRIIYRWSDDSVHVGPVGAGAPLPPGSIAKKLPSIQTPMAPSGVGVIGAPTRHQTRLGLIAVGEEWNGSYWPINLLSYAPTVPAKPQIVEISFTYPQGDVAWQVAVLDDKGNLLVRYNYASNDGDSAAIIASELATLAGGNPFGLDFGAVGDKLQVEGQPGKEFNLDVDTELLIDPWPADRIIPGIHLDVIQPAEQSRRGWDYSMPPLFQNVQATDRLSQVDAQRLAQKSVFRCYQLSGVDVSGKGPPYVPGYGPVLRTWQIQLDNSQVDQVVPELADPNIQVANPQVMPPDAANAKDVNVPLTVNFYNGFARDKPAVVYGSIALEIVQGDVWYPQLVQENKVFEDKGELPPDRLLNTPLGSQVFVPFQVLPQYFMVCFDRPVFARAGQTKDGAVLIPNLTLQTAVLVRDHHVYTQKDPGAASAFVSDPYGTNQFVAFTRVQLLDGGDPSTPPYMRHFPDVQANVTSSYDNNNKLLGWKILEADPIARADFYLQGMAYQFQFKNGQTVEYNGVKALDLDGLTWQITWTVDESGAHTQVTQNGEHSIWIPPYPARLRAEYLPPVTQVDRSGNRVNLARGFMWGPPPTRDLTS